jgi:hypothetical protein
VRARHCHLHGAGGPSWIGESASVWILLSCPFQGEV